LREYTTELSHARCLADVSPSFPRRIHAVVAASRAVFKKRAERSLPFVPRAAHAFVNVSV
jgi:hypothetical protein